MPRPSSRNTSRTRDAREKPALSASRPRRARSKRAKAKRGAKTEVAVHRVCILTGGGDAPGLNAVLRAFVKTAEGLGIETFGSEDGFEGLIHPGRMVRMTRDTVRGILPKGGSVLGCSNRANPFSYPVVDARGRERLVDVSGEVLARLKAHAIDTLVLVGGDGTMHHAHALGARGINVIGVPKTIDNDLAATDYTFGFDTALGTATWAIDALHATAESHDRVMVVEVMGRYAGWIALCAGIAGGADVVLIPEVPYDIERVAAAIRARSDAGATFSIVVVGEGARPIAGKVSALTKNKKGHLERLGGAAQQIADQLKGTIPHEVRVTVLGHLQRGGTPSAFDRVLGTRLGVQAALCCAAGRSGVMVALRGTEIVLVSIDEALKHPKLVVPTGELVETAQRVGIELGAEI
jgi:6-phosphofructokinase 1